MTKDRETSVNLGIKFLSRAQQKNGGFLSYSSSRKNIGVEKKGYPCVFPSTLILSSLTAIPDNLKVNKIKQRLASYLISQKSNQWSFNYWERDSLQSKTLPYPDDLDDTFCALTSLYAYDSHIVNGSVTANAIKLLTAVEKKEGGPYRTWIVSNHDDKRWKDIDIAVNSNIAYFLSLHDVSLTKVNNLIENAINASRYHSPYYPSPYPVIYFISRFYRGKKSKSLIDFLINQQNYSGWHKNPLWTALATSSLLNLGAPLELIEKSIDHLKETQRKDGSWPAYAFCTERIKAKKIYYAGAAALTTAFCLEAIERYHQKTDKKNINVKKTYSKQLAKIYEQVTQHAEKRFRTLGKELRQQALATLDLIIEKDRDRQIVLMPYFFKLALGENGEKIPHHFLMNLCLANLYGWIAYTIYDDFLDESGQPILLPVANICFRETIRIYGNILPANATWEKFLHTTLDTLDSANGWELARCRTRYHQNHQPDFGDLSKLSERSIGHALGPAAIMFYLGHDHSSVEIKQTWLFFIHYLIARQLNDDAHDWEEDWEKGQINSVAALIFKKAGKKHFNDRPHLQKIFWRHVIQKVGNDILKHLELSGNALKDNSLLENRSILQNFLETVRLSTLEGLKKQKQTIDFLKNY